MDFVLVKEEFASAEGFVVPGTAGHVLCNVGVNEPCSSGTEIDVGVANIRFSFAQGLHLGAMEDQAGFEAIKEVVIVGSSAILSNNLLSGFGALFGLLCGLGDRFGHRLRHNLS